MQEKPNYYAIIPANVRYNNELRANEKLLFGEITALSNATGVCVASNNYFSKLYGVVPSAITKWIKDLEKHGYISIDYIREGKEVRQRQIRLIGIHKYDEVFTNVLEGIHKCEEGYSQKLKDNNTSINNTSINNKKEIKERYFDKEELNDLFNEFLDFRKKLKAVNSDKAITLLINKLNEYDDETKMKMINQSIENSWKSVFPLKKEYKPKESGFDILRRQMKEIKEKERLENEQK